jgi:uncharacterized protein (DUF362 family)
VLAGEAPAASDGGAANAAAKPPAMTIARWQGEAPAEADLSRLATRLTEEAMRSLGGMGRFVSKGDIVWVKPNIGWNRPAELAANTNPDVVGTLVRLCLEAGAKEVKVGDNPCNDAKQTYRTSGIAAAVEKAGGRVVFLDEKRFRDVKLDGQRLKTWPLYPEILEADLVINVPIAKHHGLSRVSLAMKNYMGVIGGRRNAWHQDLPSCLTDVTAFMKPRLCILDAVRVLTAHGPQGGNPADVQRLDTVAASTDIIALDAFGAELMGHSPEQIKTLIAGFESGLGHHDYRSLALEEVIVS